MIITFSLQSYLLIQPTVIFCKVVKKSMVSKALLLVLTSIILKTRMRNSKSQRETCVNFLCMKLGKYSMKNYVIFCSSSPFLPLIQRKTSKQVACLSLHISLYFSSYSSLYEKYDEGGLMSRLCRQTNMSTFFTLLNASFTLDLNDSERKGQDLRNESITALPFSHDQQSSFSIHSKKTRLVAYSSMIMFNQVLLYSVDSLACQYNSIKLMSRLTNDQPSLPIRMQDITASIPPSRIQLYRPVNPELTPLRQNKSDVYRYDDKEENIISPFQKDQFLNEYDHPHLQKRLYAAGEGNYPRTNTRHFQTRNKIANTIPQVIKLQEMPLGRQGLSKSWTNHHNQTEHRETVTYLEQIINDLSDKKQFQITRRYIQKLQNPHLRQKLEIVVSKIQSKETSKTAEFIAIRDMLTKILRNHFKYERNIELASTQRLVKQLQKAVSKQIKEEIRVTRKESQQKVKQLKEESKLLNSKLERQTKELYKALQQEKTKMKESYEQIYRRIYEENNKLKKEFEAKEAELRQEKTQAQNVKNKYESIFNEISLRFNDVKLQYGKLINASSKQTEKNKDLKEEIRFITEKLRLQETKLKQLQAEMANQVKKYGLLEDEKTKLEQMSFKYKDYAQKFLAETKKYQNQRFQREKVQSQLKEVQNISIRKSLQQQQYANDLEASIKANQQILAQQLHKIQQNECIYQEKVKDLEALLKEKQSAQVNASNYQDRIHKLQKQQVNLQESIRRLNKEKKGAQEECAKLQDSIRILNQNRKNAQEKCAKLQEKQSIITKMINSQEQAYIKLNQETKSREKMKENLQRELTIANQEILSKKQKLLSLKIQGETQQIKNRSHLAQLDGVSRQIQAKDIQLGTLVSKIASRQTEYQSLQQKISSMHHNLASLQRQKEHLQAEQSSIIHKIIIRKSALQEINHKIAQKQTTYQQCSQELSHIQHQISSSKIQHTKLQQRITTKTAQLSNLQQVFTEKKDLMSSAENKMIQLQYSLQNMEKSNESTIKQPQSKASQHPEQQNLFDTDTFALQLVRKSLQSCIESLKSQKTKTTEQLQSLRESLRSHEEQFTKKDQQLQKLNEDLQAKYIQFVVMDEHLLSKKKELQTLQ